MVETVPPTRGLRRFSLRTMFVAVTLAGVYLALVRLDPAASLYLTPFLAAILAHLAWYWFSKNWLLAQIAGFLCAVAGGAVYGALLGGLPVCESTGLGPPDESSYFSFAKSGVFSWSSILFGLALGAAVGAMVGVVTAFLFPLAWSALDWLTMPQVAGGPRRWQFPAALLTAFFAMTIFCVLVALNRP